MENILFESWSSIVRTGIMTILAYIGMVLLLRISGKRTLSKMNAFDFIVTVALGSALANVALNKDIALADGLMVFGIFIFLQYLISWLSVRIPFVKHSVTSRPVLLLYNGNVIDEVRKKERITMEEIFVAARKQGFHQLEDVGAVILETTGDITVMAKTSSLQIETLKDVARE